MVTIEPNVIDLASITADETQIDIKITNHGLIAANNTRLNLPTHPLWQFQTLVDRIGVLRARTSVTVPMTIRRVSSGGAAAGMDAQAADAPDLGPCYTAANVCWQLVCGTLTNTYCGTIAMPNARPGCGGQPGPPPGGGCVGCGGGDPTGPGGGTYFGPSSTTTPTSTYCDPCLLKRLLAVLKCAIKWIPIPLDDDEKAVYDCVKEGIDCIKGWGNGLDRTDAYKCGKAGLKCGGTGGKLFKFLKVVECACDILTACRNIPGHNQTGVESGAAAVCDFVGITSSGVGAAGGLGLAVAAASDEVLISDPELLPLLRQAKRVRAVANYEAYLMGSYSWMRVEDEEVIRAQDWVTTFVAAIEESSYGGEWVSTAERAYLLTLPLPSIVSTNDALAMIDRWNRSLDYWDAGIFHLNQVPAGQSTNFIATDVLKVLAEAADQAFIESAAAGYSDLESGVSTEIQALKLFYTTQPPSDGVCARVKLRLEQEAVITRDAFRATLELDNNGSSRLENVRVLVDIRDKAGRMVTNLFAERFEGATVLSAVDGTGILVGNSTGTAKWLLIPTVDAAPQVATQFLVGGTLSYTLDGNDVTVEMTTVPITVLPSPRLTLQYFHQRDVFSDDPFTDIIEPSIPYNLAVMVQNRGYGLARNFHITSAQPQIIENEKGLLIDFNIIATEVFKQGDVFGLTPSLTANFGDINPGDTAIGRWLLTSTLQGLFIDYSARFEHIDGLGNPRLSLIDDVSIHEMNHLVHALGIWEDGKPDFLVNEVPDVRDLPDTLYQSNGSTNRVVVVEEASVTGSLSPQNLQVTLTAALPSDWVYLRVPDPGDGEYRLVSVERSDGSMIPLNTNVWTTDRTFIGLSRRPKRENILHLLDYNSPGAYTLTYEPGMTFIVDNDPPESRVTTLPALSRDYFQVAWQGQDHGPLGQAVSGIAYYDVFVSENGGPFTPWLQETHLVSATYMGALGSRYAFYSIAMDANGNRESAPGTPDTETLVGLTNSAPLLNLASLVAIDEGAALDLPFSASDADGDQTLSFSLLPGAPPGVILDATGRRLTWITGEGNGPSTNTVRLLVRDDGFPALATTGTVTLVVNEINAAPTLMPISDRIINEGQSIEFTAVADDPDLPRQALTFRLGQGAPSGADVEPVSGRFTWNPTELQGGTTNRLSIVVEDTGVPTLTSTQSFVVIVRDTLPDFVLSLGTTNVLRGESRRVPIDLRSSLNLTDIRFVVPGISNNLENVALQPASSGVGSTVFLSVSNRAEVTISAAPGETLPPADTLAYLEFSAPRQGASEIVRLAVDELAANAQDGRGIENGRGSGGRIFVIGQEPLLDAFITSNKTRGLVLYGKAGSNYVIETSHHPADQSEWKAFRQVRLNERYLAMELASTSEGAEFYRAYEGALSAGPRLKIGFDQGEVVVEWSVAVGDCIILATASLAPPIEWRPAVLPVEEDGNLRRLRIPLGSTGQFFKLDCSN